MWRMIIKLPLIIGVLFCVLGFSSKPTRIVGRWVGSPPNSDDKVTYVFKEDNSVIWTVDSKSSPFTTSAKYSIDYTTQPVQIDIFDFSYQPIKQFLFLGIIEFRGKNKMLLYGAPFPDSEDKTNRPKKFEADSIEFQRME